MAYAEVSTPERSWQRDPKVWVAIVFALITWASAFPGIRAGMRIGADGAALGGGFGPFELASLRFLTCSAVLVLYALASGMKLPDRRDLPQLALAGLLGISVYHAVLNYAEVRVSSGAAAVVIASSPIFTAILARLLLGERTTLRKAIGIGVAFLGVLVVAMGETGGIGLEPTALLILISAFCYASYAVLAKRPLQRYTSLQVTAVSIWFGTIPLLAFAPSMFSQMATAHPSAILSGVYLGLFPSALAYLSWNYALSRIPVTSLVVFLNSQPVTASIIAWLWLGEVPTGVTILGGAIALVGIAIVQMRNGRRDRGVEATDPA